MAGNLINYSCQMTVASSDFADNAITARFGVEFTFGFRRNLEITMKENFSCLFCGASHDASLKDGLYFFSCDTYGDIQISRRAIVEFERHPNRLDAAKAFALRCKETGKAFSATFHASEEGLRVIAA